MKTLFKSAVMILSLVAYLNSYASNGKNEKLVEKLSGQIENAAPDDWYILASSAETCLKKDINCKEVAIWIDRSLDIKTTPYNLEIKGDYYLVNKMPEEAGKYYLQAMKLGNELDPEFNGYELQKKLAKLINLKTNS